MLRTKLTISPEKRFQLSSNFLNREKIMNPKVSIIILNWNGWTDTIECIESVLRSDYPNFHVIVSDNNSPNGSLEYIRQWADGKIDVGFDEDRPLKRLSFPPVVKPIPYVNYTKEQAESGGDSEFESRLKLHARHDGVNMAQLPLRFVQ